jgi:hypothetical protein
MSRLITTARNITHSIHDGKLYTEIEAVLGVVDREPQNVNGDLVVVAKPRDIRFVMSAETADVLLGDLAKWIEEAKRQAASIEIKEASE